LRLGAFSHHVWPARRAAANAHACLHIRHARDEIQRVIADGIRRKVFALFVTALRFAFGQANHHLTCSLCC
jgi:hypothetical protein